MLSRINRVCVLAAIAAAFALTPSDADAFGLRRSHSSRSYRATSYTQPFSSPGYEYRYRRSEARTAVGYNRLFGI